MNTDELEQLAQVIAQAVFPQIEAAASLAGSGIHIALVMSPENPGWATYVANSERESTIQLLREVAAVIEVGGDVEPGNGGCDGRPVTRFDLREMRAPTDDLDGCYGVWCLGRLRGTLTLTKEEAREDEPQ